MNEAEDCGRELAAWLKSVTAQLEVRLPRAEGVHYSLLLPSSSAGVSSRCCYSLRYVFFCISFQLLLSTECASSHKSRGVVCLGGFRLVSTASVTEWKPRTHSWVLPRVVNISVVTSSVTFSNNLHNERNVRGSQNGFNVRTPSRGHFRFTGHGRSREDPLVDKHPANRCCRKTSSVQLVAK